MKFKINKAAFDALPANIQALYNDNGDGTYTLQIEGAVSAEKLAEFRDKNIELTNKLKTFETGYEGISAELAQELLKKRKDIEDGKRSDGKTVGEIVEERTAEMKAAHEREKNKLTGELATTKTALEGLKIGDAAIAAATAKGMRKTASDDIKARAAAIFKLGPDGNVVAMDGEKIRYGATGEPLTVQEWVDTLVEKAEHLFEPSNGTGAKPGGGGHRPGGQVNPWEKASWNLTHQGELFRKDAPLARKLAAEAGHTLP